MSKRLRSPIVWFGGKGHIVNKLLPLIPSHKIYVEPFGGGANLLIAKEPSPVEIYNDLDIKKHQRRTENVWLSPNCETIQKILAGKD